MDRVEMMSQFVCGLQIGIANVTFKQFWIGHDCLLGGLFVKKVKPKKAKKKRKTINVYCAKTNLKIYTV